MDLNATKILENAGRLAVLTHIIGAIRDGRALSEDQLDFLKSLMSPWRHWVMNQDPNVFSEHGSLLLGLLSCLDLEANKAPLDAICEHLWKGAELKPEDNQYLLTMLREIRRQLL